MAVSRSVARELDVVQAKARYSSKLNGIEPEFTIDTSLQLTAARHPMLEHAVPVDVLLDSAESRAAHHGPEYRRQDGGPENGGAVRADGAGGAAPAAKSARLPVFRCVFADIGDEQSIETSLSTFSSHITNLVAMDRELQPPALVLLDEVGTGTDPNEGGALATAIVQHFRQRGALVMATTHFDAVKTWGIGTEGVAVAAFAFDPQTFAPTYRLIYGAPGRSLAIEMAQRLGMPQSVIGAARGYLSDDQKRLQAHLSRLDAQARALESDRVKLERERRAFNETNAELTRREKSLAEREEVFKKRLNERLDERLRQAKRDVDAVIDQLKEKSDAIAEKASLRAAINTGETGSARAEARAEIDRIVEDLRHPAKGSDPVRRTVGRGEAADPEIGARVAIGGLGFEGTVISIDGNRAEIDVRGKRIQAKVKELRVINGPPGHRPAGEGSRQCRPEAARGIAERAQRDRHDRRSSRRSRLTFSRRYARDRSSRGPHRARPRHRAVAQRRHHFLKNHPLVQKYYAAAGKPGRRRRDDRRVEGVTCHF